VHEQEPESQVVVIRFSGNSDIKKVKIKASYRQYSLNLAKTSLYRREMTYIEKLLLMAAYKNHLSSRHGLYSKDKRAQLLWLAKTPWQEKLDLEPFEPSEERIDNKYSHLLYSWFQDIRDRAKAGLLDLKLLCDLLTEDQLKEVFSPLGNEEQLRLDKAEKLVNTPVGSLPDSEKRLLYQHPPIPREHFKDASRIFSKVKNELHIPVGTGYIRADLQIIVRTILTPTYEENSRVDLDNWKDKLAVDLLGIVLQYLGPKSQLKAQGIQTDFRNVADYVGATYYGSP
jgi:hypothetical protein